MGQQDDTWHADLEAHKALIEEARKYKRKHPPSGDIFVYPPIEGDNASETDEEALFEQKREQVREELRKLERGFFGTQQEEDAGQQAIAEPMSYQQMMFHDLAAVSDLATLARKQETLFSARGYTGIQGGPDIRVESFGSLPLLFSAPHSVRHFPLNRKEKVPDLHTGTIALQLAMLTGATALVYAHSSKEEPNGDKPEDSLYKQTLIEAMRETQPYFFLDIHGLDDVINASLIIGNADGKSIQGYKDIQTKLKDALRKAGLEKVRERCAPYYTNPNKYYCPDADYPTSNTLWVHNSFGIPALQLEIGWEARDFHKHKTDYERFIVAMMHAIFAMVAFCKQVSPRPSPQLKKLNAIKVELDADYDLFITDRFVIKRLGKLLVNPKFTAQGIKDLLNKWRLAGSPSNVSPFAELAKSIIG